MESKRHFVWMGGVSLAKHVSVNCAIHVGCETLANSSYVHELITC
jgi:hypothetical protein